MRSTHRRRRPLRILLALVLSVVTAGTMPAQADPAGLVVQQVAGPWTRVLGRTMTYAEATCPAGLQAVGGGKEGNAGIVLSSSQPVNDRTWWVHGYNELSTEATMRAWVICANGLTDYAWAGTAGRQPAAGQSDTAAAQCPGGTKVLGGGLRFGPVGHHQVESTEPAAEFNQWWATWRTFDAGSWWNPIAVCANGFTAVTSVISTTSGSVSCPSGYAVISGGGAGNPGGPLIDSWPSGGGTWSVTARNGLMRVKALCAR